MVVQLVFQTRKVTIKRGRVKIWVKIHKTKSLVTIKFQLKEIVRKKIKKNLKIRDQKDLQKRIHPFLSLNLMMFHLMKKRVRIPITKTITIKIK